MHIGVLRYMEMYDFDYKNNANMLSSFSLTGLRLNSRSTITRLSKISDQLIIITLNSDLQRIVCKYFKNGKSSSILNIRI